MQGLVVTGSALSVEITRKASDNTLVDYAAQSLAVPTGTSASPSSVTLDIAANLGEVTRASGNLTVDAFGFVTVVGGFGIEAKQGQVRLSGVEDDEDTPSVGEATAPVSVDMLLIGGSDLTAYAGTGDVGLNLTDVEFGLAMLTEQVTGGPTPAARKWTSVQAMVGEASIAGVDGLTVEVTTLELQVNREAGDGSVVDYALTASTTDAPELRNTALAVPTGPGTSLDLTMDGADG